MNQRLLLSGIALLIFVSLLAGPALAATVTCPSSCSCLLPAEAAKINTPGLCNGKQTVCASDGKINKYCYLKPVTTTTVVPQFIVTGYHVITPTTTVPAFVKCEPGCFCDYEPAGEMYNLTLCGGRQTLCGMDHKGVRMYCYVQPPPPPSNIVPPITLVTMSNNILPEVTPPTTLPKPAVSYTVTPTATTLAPAGSGSCTPGCSCLSSDKADAAGFKRCSESQKPCGYDPRNVARYCYIVDPGSPADNIPDRMPVNAQLPAEPSEPDKAEPQAITRIGIIDSFIGMFSSIFGNPAPKPPITPVILPPTGVAFDPGLFPRFGSYRVATTIHPGATVYIGEEHLNVTNALVEIVPIMGISPAGGPRVPGATKIGWFASDPYTTAPTKIVNLGVDSRYRDLTISPADFVGYGGTWYVLRSDELAPANDHAGLFIVRDPSLGLSVSNAATGTSVSGATVHAGDQLRFSITKNIGVVSSSGTSLREPITDSVNDGFMDIVVTAPGGRKLTQLDIIAAGGTPGVADLTRPCWNLPADSTCNPSYTWNTGATFGNGTAKYPPGTYTVQVISKLNNMHDNYLNAGALYEGKTASQRVSFTLA